jgi:HK97 family phage prohead protease
MDRKKRQMRGVPGSFKTRAEESGDMFISGYFAVFGSEYELWPGASESVDPHAFDEALDDDIRCLINHDTRLVLGRNIAGTLQLRVEEKGLWGEVKINPNDQDAVNVYERVKRGDVNQCSFGFDIVAEEFEDRGDSVHWTIKAVKLYEVSVVTFPAYEETGVEARKRQVEDIRKRKNESWRARMMARMKGEKNGTKETDASS